MLKSHGVMNLTKREQALLERLEARGYQLDKSQEGMPFTFSISPVISVGVDASIFANLSRGLIFELKQRGYKCALGGIVVFPRILDPKVKKAKTLSIHKRKDNVYFVGFEIEFDTWMKSTRLAQINLALLNLQESIAEIPERHISSEHRKQLIEIIRVVATKEIREFALDRQSDLV